MGVALGVFLFTYILFFRRSTFFRFNRFFLLFGFVFSLIIPFIRYTYDIIIPAPLYNYTESITTTTIPIQEKDFNLWGILLSVYLAGICIILLKNTFAYFRLYVTIKNSTKQNENGYILIENEKIQSPFSVLNYILLNSNKLNNTEKKLILEHEKTHVNQRHWIDLICSECMLLLQWFNPLIWIYVRLMKENHEYLADKAVIDSGVSPSLYQAVLINQRFQGPIFSFSNSFNYLKPLNRLSMIKKVKTPSWKRAIALIIAPIFGLFVWASAEPRYVFEGTIEVETLAQQEDSIIVKGYRIPKDSVKVIGYGKADSIFSIKKNNRSKTNKKNESFFVRGVNNSTTGSSEFFIRGINPDKKQPLRILDGKKISNSEFEKLDVSSIYSFSVLKDASATAAYGDEGKNGVIIIETKDYNKDNISLKADKISIVGDLTVEATNAEAIANKENIHIKRNPISIVSIPASSQPLIILDGKEITQKEFDEIDSNTIESVSVVKDKSATTIYGSKAKNGVILITVKKKK